MRTKTLVQTAIAAAALAWASASFAATPTVPTQPPAIPGGGLDSGALTGNGGLIVAVWDSATGSSLVQWLGLNYNQIGISDMTTAGTTLDFGTLGGFSTTFANAIGAGQQSRLQYLVVAADAFSQPDSAGFGPPYNRGLRVTGQANLGAVESGDGQAPNVSGAGNAVASYIDSVINGTAAAPQSCAKANPCSIVNNAASPIYFGKSTAAGDLGGNAPSTTSYAGAVGTALAFFDLTTQTEDQAANDGFTAFTAFASQYANAQWLLNAAGQLVYSVAGGGGPTVPLPAAGWLLLSGLAGMGVIGRRRKASAEVAA
jgi:hypothetical protein